MNIFSRFPGLRYKKQSSRSLHRDAFITFESNLMAVSLQIKFIPANSLNSSRFAMLRLIIETVENRGNVNYQIDNTAEILEVSIDTLST